MVLCYKCVFTDSEMYSDSYASKKAYNDQIVMVKSKFTNIEAVGGDIGDAEDIDDEAQRVIDLVHAYKYEQTTFTKKTFLPYIKNYMQNVIEHLKKKGASDEEVEAFKKGSQEFVKYLLENFKEFEFYMNDQNSTDGACAFAFWEDPENDEGPTFCYIQAGLVGEKY